MNFTYVRQTTHTEKQRGEGQVWSARGPWTCLCCSGRSVTCYSFRFSWKSSLGRWCHAFGNTSRALQCPHVSSSSRRRGHGDHRFSCLSLPVDSALCPCADFPHSAFRPHITRLTLTHTRSHTHTPSHTLWALPVPQPPLCSRTCHPSSGP